MHRVVVFDTNVLISAQLSTHGNSFRCLELAMQGAIQSVTCREILAEFEGKLREKFLYSKRRARAAAAEVRQISQLVTIPHGLRGVTTDPDDDMVVECALVGNATHIITGDRRHLLPLGCYQGVDIVTPAQFLALVASS